MSCHGCASKFGFLKREHGCPVCGFAYCSKCLKYEQEVSTPQSNARVCRSCSQELKDTRANPNSLSSTMNSKPPPDAFLRRLATLEDPSRPPVTVYTAAPALQVFQAQPSEPPSEQELRGRLQKLRKRLTSAPSVEEMEDRLARLQGMAGSSKAHSIDFTSALPRTEAEQTQHLMQQLTQETGLDLQMDQERAKSHLDLEARLAKLKGLDTQHPIQSDTLMAEPSDPETLCQQLASQVRSRGSDEMLTESPDAEESELQIVKKLLAQVALDEKLVDADSSEEEPISEQMGEELPWCCMCTEDASLRCPSCGGDLFCAGCFRAAHDVCDMNDHRPMEYKQQQPS